MQVIKRKIMLSAIAAISMAAVCTGVFLFGPNSGGNQSLQLSKSDYYDKTLAGIIGQVGGVLTGYEFISEDPLPDEWFGWIKGPYSGRSNYIVQEWNERIFEERGGGIGSDDDYHIDFFNQHILDVHGPGVSYQDIMEEWIEHEVSDWGGSFSAMENMLHSGITPPFTGKSEFNPFYWVTEAYIENDTLGMTAPGMPRTAAELTKKFASLSGEFDSVTWAVFQGAMYSVAYFETDVRIAMEKASAVLPRNSWPYQIYQKVLELHEQNPDDWRWAQGELRKVKRSVYGWDNIQVIPDINNALAIISILYGGNDYTESARIASLSGYDADCTASFVMGLMGIIKGMDGTPQEVKDAIYADGEGTYINDFGFTPHIGKNYPEEQKFADIAKLYQSNAERMIAAKGGEVLEDSYVIPGEKLYPAVVIPIANGDFEQGNLDGWTAWSPNGELGGIYTQNNETALSGDWKGRIDINQDVQEGKLYVKATGLKKGKAYHAKAFLTADDGLEARLFADEFGGDYIYASVMNETGFYASRTLEFVAGSSSALIGLHAKAAGQGSLAAAIDNLTLEEIELPPSWKYEAEAAQLTAASVEKTASASGERFVRFAGERQSAAVFDSVSVEAAGEYMMTIQYANSWLDTARLDLLVNGVQTATVWFPRTGAATEFSANRLEVPVKLQAGANAIEFIKAKDLYGVADIDYIQIAKEAKPVYTK